MESPAKKKSAARRKWEVFLGRNKFFCDRRTGVFYLTLLIILVTSGLYLAFQIFHSRFFLAHRLDVMTHNQPRSVAFCAPFCAKFCCAQASSPQLLPSFCWNAALRPQQEL